MFERSSQYPCAIADGTDEGLSEGFDWCSAKMHEGDTLTIFVATKGSLTNSDLPNAWLRKYRDVKVETARGFVHVERGPVLALWPSAKSLGDLSGSTNRITALCVASWNEGEVGPWVAASQAEALSTADEWARAAEMDLEPEVETALHSMTQALNHNNTISAGFEKSIVVSSLLRLHDAGHYLPSDKLEGWAIANGWKSGNPAKLADYAVKINGGSRPRTP